MTIITKRQIIKVYNQAGQFIDVWRDAPLLGLDSNSQPPKFALNTVTGQVTINLPRPFDAFDEGGDSRGRGSITAGNIVQIWVYDNASLTAGRMVYQGYIDGYIPQIGTDGSEIVQVILTSFDAALGDVKFIGTQQFGLTGTSSGYVDTVQMFDWPFGALNVATTAVQYITGGTTITLNLTSVAGLVVGMALYLQGNGNTPSTTDGPLYIASIDPPTNQITFTAPIPNNYNNLPLLAHAVFVSTAPSATSNTAVTGGVTSTIAVSSVANLTPNMPVKIISDIDGGGTLGPTENATILNISGLNVTFTAPLANSYSMTIGICPTAGYNPIMNQPYTYPLTLDSGNPATSGYLNSAQFHNQSLVDWFEQVRNLSPLNWYWRVTPTKTVIFKAASTIAQHTFTIGKDISQPQYQKDYTNLRNDIYVKGTGVSARATGSDVTIYGDRMETIVEPRIIDANTAQRYANAVLGQLDKVDYRATITIVDIRGDASGLGYDIETINVGESCTISDPGYNQVGAVWDGSLWDSDYWDYPPNSQIDQVTTISAMTYKFDTLDLELSSLQPSQDKYLVNLARQYESSQLN